MLGSDPHLETHDFKLLHGDVRVKGLVTGRSMYSKLVAGLVYIYKYIYINK